MRNPDGSDRLFARAALSDALRKHTAAIPQRVQAIAESVIQAVDDDSLASQLAQELKIVPLSLDLSGQTMRREEVQVDVTGDRFRIGAPDGRRLVVPGIRVTVSIPYVGDEQLWRLRPSSYRLSAPRGTVRPIRGMNIGVIDLVIEQPSDQPIERIKSELDSRLDDINFFIENQVRDLVGFDADLRHQVLVALGARRARLTKHDRIAELLGIPEVVSSTPVPQPPPGSHSHPSATEQTSEPASWDVFVSHASEDKEVFVRALVAQLTKAGLKVWFDEQTLCLGDSLRRSIDRGLARSRYGVVVISPSFLAKQWPQRELDGLVAREEDGAKVILPVWHQVSADEIRRSSPTLADRLAISSSRGADEVAKEILHVVRPT